MRSLLRLSATGLLLLLLGVGGGVDAKRSEMDYGLTTGDHHLRAKRDIVEQHSLHPPYISDFWSEGVPSWDFFGAAVVTDHFLRLTPDAGGKFGSAWNLVELENAGWEMTMGFRVSSKSPIGADGFALWLVEEIPHTKSGPLFGHPAKFSGVGITFDSYDNDFKKDNPAVSAIYSDGIRQEPFNTETDFFGQHSGTCVYDYRNSLKPDIIIARVTYHEEELSVYMSHSNSGATEQKCFTATGIKLPERFFMGLTADTGGVSDNHDVYFLHTVPILDQWKQDHEDYDHSKRDYKDHHHHEEQKSKDYWKAKSPEEQAQEELEQKRLREKENEDQMRDHYQNSGRGAQHHGDINRGHHGHGNDNYHRDDERAAQVAEDLSRRHRQNPSSDEFGGDEDEGADHGHAAYERHVAEQQQGHPNSGANAAANPDHHGENVDERNPFENVEEDHPVHQFDHPKPGTKEWERLPEHVKQTRYEEARSRHAVYQSEKDRVAKEEQEKQEKLEAERAARVRAEEEEHDRNKLEQARVEKLHHEELQAQRAAHEMKAKAAEEHAARYARQTSRSHNVPPPLQQQQHQEQQTNPHQPPQQQQYAPPSPSYQGGAGQQQQYQQPPAQHHQQQQQGGGNQQYGNNQQAPQGGGGQQQYNQQQYNQQPPSHQQQGGGNQQQPPHQYQQAPSAQYNNQHQQGGQQQQQQYQPQPPQQQGGGGGGQQQQRYQQPPPQQQQQPLGGNADPYQQKQQGQYQPPQYNQQQPPQQQGGGGGNGAEYHP